MAGYVGTKAVLLSTTAATVGGDADIGGALDVGGAFTSQGIDDNATSTAMTLDASGNLLVSATTTSGFQSSSSESGTIAYAAGGIASNSPSNDVAGVFNRLGTDGIIVQLKKDGSTAGIIGVAAGDNLYIGSTAVNHGGIYMNDTGVLPMSGGSLTDNTRSLGGSSNRWATVFAATPSINTSDRNEKQDIAELSDAEQRVAVACKGLIRKFKFNDAVEAKGNDARIHVGIIAQDLQAAFAAEGLDAGDYAMFISSTWTDEETGEERTRMGVRYSELLAFIIGAL